MLDYEGTIAVDLEEHARNTEGKGSKALKRRRRQEAPPISVESSKGTENIKLLKFQETGRVREAREGSSKVDA